MSLCRSLLLVSILLVSQLLNRLNAAEFSIVAENSLASAQAFLVRFETAVMNHDEQAVLTFFDETYKKEQHDQFLKGNTEQFLKDFFCGNTTKLETYSCLALNEIKKMKRVSLDLMDENECVVQYKVKAQDRIIILYAAIYRKTYNGLTQWGFVGAVG